MTSQGPQKTWKDVMQCYYTHVQKLFAHFIKDRGVFMGVSLGSRTPLKLPLKLF